MTPKTARAIARRYEAEGLEPALYEKPRPGKQRGLDAGQRGHMYFRDLS